MEKIGNLLKDNEDVSAQLPQFYIFKDMLADLLEINMIRSTLETQYGEDANVIRRKQHACITMPTLSQVAEREDSKQLEEIIRVIKKKVKGENSYGNGIRDHVPFRTLSKKA